MNYINHHPRTKRHGVSLMMVMAVVAVATVMGMAILSSNTLQAEASTNQDQAWQADAMAESGINLGLYWLQNLGDSDASKCPAQVNALPNPSITPYTRSNVSLGAASAGTFDVSVGRTSKYRYTVDATGHSNGSGGVARKMAATVDVNYYGYALIATNPTTGSLTIPANTTVYGDIYSSIPVVNNGTILGTVYASAVSGSGSGGGLLGALLSIVAGLLSPSTSDINHYLNYTYNGRPGTAELILTGTLDN